MGLLFSFTVLGSGIVSAYFIRYLWPYRDKLGGWFFIATIGCEAFWGISYGVALFVSEPLVLRWLFEIPIWASINFIGVFFLAFALEYTGRSHIVRSKWMGVIVLVQIIHTLIVATNPLHQIAWTNYHIEPVLETATVSYTHEPWLFINFVGIYIMVAAGSFLLFDTFFSYGSLYQSQAAAIALSPVLPGLAFFIWLLEIGPTFPLNLTPLTFPAHLAIDMYALFRRNMFELTPAARRVSERAALDDLGSAVIIVDDEHQMINLNEEAKRVLGVETDESLGSSLESHLQNIDLSVEDQTVSILTGGERREYAVTTSSVKNSTGEHIGYTVVLQDITTEKQREQRLEVLNRVLRHNLRNDLNVVMGSIDLATDTVEDESIQNLLERAEKKTSGVVELGEKAQRIEEMLKADELNDDPLNVVELLEDIKEDFSDKDVEADIELQVPETFRIRANSRILEGVFRNLIENAIEHNDSKEKSVSVVLVENDSDDNSAIFEVRDNGPGIPDHELKVIQQGKETDLEHGSGLGLWGVKWGLVSLGGDISFETDEDGTTARLRIPNSTDDTEVD